MRGAPFGHAVEHLRNLVHVGRNGVADNPSNGNLHPFDSGHESAERSADTLVHFQRGLRRHSVDALQFCNESVQLIDVAAQLQSGK
ncbi:hypothetical protein SDC9_89796 [bioreactor metagenome]|uniref:Uncharacterized protein n=1 Tax=bioreactor metagenome TaxID=1076179 RepID=A0A644ZWV2_9ZZZZ